jgi:hypothetical protein
VLSMAQLLQGQVVKERGRGSGTAMVVEARVRAERRVVVKCMVTDEWEFGIYELDVVV